MKHLFFIFLTAVLTTTVLGQQNKFDFGLEGSYSKISLRGNELLDIPQPDDANSPSIGFSSGLSFQYNFLKHFSIRTDIAFERKGAIRTGLSAAFTTRTNFDYLTFPILMKATIGGRIKFFFNTGPFFSYLLKQTIVTNPPKTIYDRTFSDKRFDTGITAGLGLSIPIIEKFSIAFEIRNNLGLYNVNKVFDFNGGTIKTNSTNLLIEFIYKFKDRQIEKK